MLYCNFFNKNIDLDYPEIIRKCSDMLFLIYNKFTDKSCFQPDLVDYITMLDDIIYENFIEIVANDLHLLAEFCTKKEFENINKELDKHFN